MKKVVKKVRKQVKIDHDPRKLIMLQLKIDDKKRN